MRSKLFAFLAARAAIPSGVLLNKRVAVLFDRIASFSSVVRSVCFALTKEGSCGSSGSFLEEKKRAGVETKVVLNFLGVQQVWGGSKEGIRWVRVFVCTGRRNMRGTRGGRSEKKCKVVCETLFKCVRLQSRFLVVGLTTKIAIFVATKKKGALLCR